MKKKAMVLRAEPQLYTSRHGVSAVATEHRCGDEHGGSCALAFHGRAEANGW